MKKQATTKRVRYIVVRVLPYYGTGWYVVPANDKDAYFAALDDKATGMPGCAWCYSLEEARIECEHANRTK